LCGTTVGLVRISDRVRWHARTAVPGWTSGRCGGSASTTLAERTTARTKIALPIGRRGRGRFEFTAAWSRHGGDKGEGVFTDVARSLIVPHKRTTRMLEAAMANEREQSCFSYSRRVRQDFSPVVAGVDALDPATVEQIHARVVQIARSRSIAPGRRLRTDTTVVG
jgi:hypothetical protein